MTWPFGLDTSMLGGWLPLPRRSGALRRLSVEIPRRSSGAQLPPQVTAEHPLPEK